jgi:hypothetical protein
MFALAQGGNVLSLRRQVSENAEFTSDSQAVTWNTGR